jgi:molybdate transport system regulatory protein
MRADVKVRLLSDGEIAMGPGKADLLQAIAETGSISAAARRMDMSYRRAWLLVGVMNKCFTQPLVQSAVGGQKGGGAHLSETGVAVLAQFRAVQAAAEAAAQDGMQGLAALLRPEDAAGNAALTPAPQPEGRAARAPARSGKPQAD